VEPDTDVASRARLRDAQRVTDDARKLREPRPGEPRVLSVLELNAHARRLLESRGGEVWVEGEIADLTRPASGHLYFMLGDGRAQVKCTMYRTDVAEIGFELAAGLQIRVRGGLTIYEQRGTFQLQVREVLEAGEGSRAAALARIKKKLAADGLLDPGRKRALPPYPRAIGVVTSRDGAAFRDVVKVALDRFPARVFLVHALVQGPDAPEQVVAALAHVQKLRSVDVIILARGGGATEDLAAFDDERVARAVAASRVPIVTGIGHEIDITLADLCADVRAATPSNAAERAVPSIEAIRRDIVSKERALQRAFDQLLDGHRLRLERARRSLADPRRLLRTPRTGLVASERALERTMRRRVAEQRSALARLTERLARVEPRARLVRDRARLEALRTRLAPAMERLLVARGRARLEALTTRLAPVMERLIVARARARLEALTTRLSPAIERLLAARRHTLGRQARALDALSPLAVLDRGYAIATIASSGLAVRDAQEAPVGTRLRVRVARGQLDAEVVEPDAPEREIA